MAFRGWVISTFVVWSLLIAYLLFAPLPQKNKIPLFPGVDKVAHLGLFAVWAGLLTILTQKDPARFNKLALGFVVLSVVAFGLVTEWIQSFIPYREGDLSDFLFDLSGGLLGITGWLILKKELFRIEKKFDK